MSKRGLCLPASSQERASFFLSELTRRLSHRRKEHPLGSTRSSSRFRAQGSHLRAAIVGGWISAVSLTLRREERGGARRSRTSARSDVALEIYTGSRAFCSETYRAPRVYTLLLWLLSELQRHQSSSSAQSSSSKLTFASFLPSLSSSPPGLPRRYPPRLPRSLSEQVAHQPQITLKRFRARSMELQRFLPSFLS